MSHATEAEPTDFHSSYIPWRDFLVRQNLIPLAIVSLAVWLHAGDSLVVATMMPSMVDDIGGEAVVGWSVSLYQLSSIVAGAASALLSLRYGLRNAMALAAMVFAIGCLISAVGLTMPMVLAGRLVQGFGGGGLVAMGFVGVSLMFEPRYRARAIAVISTLWGIAAFLGPIIGSVFVAYANWRWGFVFFAFKAVLLCLWLISQTDSSTAKIEAEQAPFPWRRLGLLAIAILLVSFAGVEVTLGRSFLLVMAGGLAIVWFLKVDASAQSNRLLPMRALDLRKPHGAGLVMSFCMSFSTVGLAAFGPLLLTAIHGADPIVIGYVVAAAAIGWSVAAVLTSGIAEVHQGKMILFGMSLVGGAVLGLAYAVPFGELWLVSLLSFAEGAGFGMCWHFILARLTAKAPADEIHRISAAIPTIQRLGYALGAAYLGIVANASGILELDQLDQAQRAGFWIFASCIPTIGLGLVAAILFAREPEDENKGYRA
ncbi:MAG: MFS transporter [Cognatishimia sp.]|uniref:MFS transporter n=1 Tax=Cognatishimia sp. TaxID=2211648 RepID=UPI003B8CC73D